jgi:DNA-binding response OmpR family regulator
MERPKILIVDDDPDIRRASKIRLRPNHYDAVQASDGYSAIAVAQKQQSRSSFSTSIWLRRGWLRGSGAAARQ